MLNKFPRTHSILSYCLLNLTNYWFWCSVVFENEFSLHSRQIRSTKSHCLNCLGMAEDRFLLWIVALCVTKSVYGDWGSSPLYSVFIKYLVPVRDIQIAAVKMSLFTNVFTDKEGGCHKMICRSCEYKEVIFK